MSTYTIVSKSGLNEIDTTEVTINAGGHAVKIHDGFKSMLINNFATLKHIPYTERHGLVISRAYRSALMGLHFQDWKITEVGFYSRHTMEELNRLGVSDNAGYLTSLYRGDNPNLQALKPVEGIVRLQYFLGEFRVLKTITKDTIPQPVQGEPEWCKHDRSALALYGIALPAILSGLPIRVSPWELKDGQPGELNAVGGQARHYDEQRVIAEMAFMVRLISNPDIEAAKNERRAHLEDTIIRQDAARAYRSAERKPQPTSGPMIPLLVNGEVVMTDPAQLEGQTLQIVYKQGHGSTGLQKTVTASSYGYLTELFRFGNKVAMVVEQ